MRVEVRFYGFVQDIANNKRLALDLPAGSTLRDLFSEMMNLFGQRFRQRLFTSSGDLEPNVQIFVDGDQACSLDQPVADRPQSEVKIFVLSATAGG